MGANIGWLFYKDYFNSLDKSDYEYFSLSKDEQKKQKIKKEDIEAKIDNKVENIIIQTPKIEEFKDEDILGNTHFQAITTYPGLLLGSGNAHELPSIEGQAILGFHFDYTSGLPVIQGSSIKGVLRSAFKHPEFIKELLGDDFDVKALEKDIFDNNDIFFDAVIIKADTYNKILGDDFLAPHGDNPLENPKPLRFIKVLPNVTFRFDFEFSDGLISKSNKTELFREILLHLGLGAKTNVGYGQFENFKPYRTELEEQIAKEEAKKRLEQEKIEQELELQKQREDKEKAELEKQARLEAEQKAKEDEEKAKKEAFASQGIDTILNGCEKFAQLENSLKKYIQIKPLDDNEKQILENHILNNMNDKIKRRRFPFGTIGNDKCLGKERANEIADKLNLS
jgi:CRISPR-associated protein Cmr6